MNVRKPLVVMLLGAALVGGSAQLFADPAPGFDYGPGMMGPWGCGMGPGAGYGDGGGYGMGPGMGPGMMYGYGGGRGMGPGMGPGMYGYGPGWGMGPGMMHRYGPAAALDLTDEQRSKIGKIQQDLRSKQWSLMGKIHDEYSRRADAPDDATADKADDQIVALRQQMLSNANAARKEMDGVLTKEQRKLLRRDGY